MKAFPTRVVKLAVNRPRLTPYRAGQYVFVNIPEIAYFQWHPFMLTSCPEEDNLCVHVRVHVAIFLFHLKTGPQRLCVEH